MTVACVPGLSVNSPDMRAVLPPLLRLDSSFRVDTSGKQLSFCDVTKGPDRSQFCFFFLWEAASRGINVFDALNIWDKNSDKTTLTVADSFKQTTCSDKRF